MKTDNATLMKQAREALAGRWGLAIGVCVLYMVIMVVVGAPHKIGQLLSFLIAGPMMIGISTFSLAFVRRQEATISELFVGFNEFGRALLAYFLMVLFVLLWLLLLIVPGIVAALSYSQTFFILAEDKTITASDALKKSKAMMYGHKMQLFLLGLRFIGWVLLSILTLGIGFLWLMPYVQMTKAKFYEDLKSNPPSPAV